MTVQVHGGEGVAAVLMLGANEATFLRFIVCRLADKGCVTTDDMAAEERDMLASMAYEMNEGLLL